MTTISVRLPENLLNEIDQKAKELHIARAEYIRKALDNLNSSVAAAQRRDRMIKASQRVRKESMKVNAEFSEIEHEPES